jgi:microsomal epoxide hydrolase
MPAEIWETQLRHFAGRYRVIAIDPRSQGRSGQPSEGHYPERRARDIREVVAQLGLGPAVLVGWSLAVPELLTLADDIGSDSLRALVLVDGFIGADRAPDAGNPLVPTLLALQRDRRAFTEGFVRGMFRRPVPEAYLVNLIEQSLATPTNTAFTLLGNLLLGRGDWRPALDRLKCPLLYVVSGVLAGQAEMVRQRKPSARVEVFADAGHALFVDEAERFNALLDAFLAGLEHEPRPVR